MPEMQSTHAEIDRLPTDEDWGRLQFTTLLYYLHDTNPDNGLVRDKTESNAPASIAAIGMALAAIPVIVERGIIIREFAAKIARKRLRYLMECPQGPEPDASGYKGFFYHFLDIETGRRVWQCELSTVDSAFLFAGALTVATYFDRDTADEAEIRHLATALYERADWNWACAGGLSLTHGWRPESGFIPHRWQGYDEGLLLYILGLGSPTHPLHPQSYAAYTCNLRMEENLRPRTAIFGTAFYASAIPHVGGLSRHPRRLHASPRQRLFREQPAGDVRAAGIRDPQPDEFCRLRSILLGVHRVRRARLGHPSRQWRRATVLRLQRPRRSVRSRRRDGRAMGCHCLVAIRTGDRHTHRPQFCRMNLGMTRLYGFKPSFNPSFTVENSPTGFWVTPSHFGIDQGPVVLMIENFRTGLLWNLMRRCSPIVKGLRRAGFSGGWL